MGLGYGVNRVSSKEDRTAAGEPSHARGWVGSRCFSSGALNLPADSEGEEGKGVSQGRITKCELRVWRPPFCPRERFASHAVHALEPVLASCLDDGCYGYEARLAEIEKK